MTLKRPEFRTPNRVAINTGHKTFDQQCDCLTTGNVVSNTQYSSYVRAVSNTECNGCNFKPGHLRAFDLKLFAKLPSHVRYWYEEHPNIETILYEFRHFRKGKKIVHGYVITDTQHNLLLKAFSHNSQKSIQVVNTCTPYIAVKGENG